LESGYFIPYSFIDRGNGNQLLKSECNDGISIQMIESLRKKGATWLGIVGVQQNKIEQEHPILLKYLNKNCNLKEHHLDWTVDCYFQHLSRSSNGLRTYPNLV
jgi:hypothetical protein